jgi:hypothetical protein
VRSALFRYTENVCCFLDGAAGVDLRDAVLRVRPVLDDLLGPHDAQRVGGGVGGDGVQGGARPRPGVELGGILEEVVVAAVVADRVEPRRVDADGEGRAPVAEGLD